MDKKQLEKVLINFRLERLWLNLLDKKAIRRGETRTAYLKHLIKSDVIMDDIKGR